MPPNPQGLEAIRYERGRLEVLDQLRLPHESHFDKVSTCGEAFDCIKSMRVRGAPAIAIVAALALAVELEHKKDNATDKKALKQYVDSQLDYMKQSRPTAVDLSNAIEVLKRITDNAAAANTVDGEKACATIREAYIKAAEKIFKDDRHTNLAIGINGAEYLRRLQPPLDTPSEEIDQLLFFTTSPPGTQGAPDKTYRKLSVLTHCNTGSLATSGHGTALGIIRSLHKMNYLEHAYCTETRPYNQGARLTAYELVQENIPATLITDSMAGALFQRKKAEKNITAVIVGADRVARNGDTANKIGTYALAVLAKYHGIKFVVAAPTTSIDLKTVSGEGIKIEDRAQSELTQITGAVVDSEGKVDVSKTARVAIADQRIGVWNPAFDVTPHALIDAIITEKGEVLKDAEGNFNFAAIMPERWALQVGGEKGFASSAKEDETQFPIEDIA